MSISEQWDVIVVGAGNAALTAAVSARAAGAKVLVLEKGTEELRGGNSYFTGGGFRMAYKPEDVPEILSDLSEDELHSFEVEGLSTEEFYADIMRTTQGRADPELAEKVVQDSQPTIRFLQGQGMKYELSGGPDAKAPRAGRLYFASRIAWLHAHGGGAGLCDQLFGLLEKMGARVLYETKAVKLLMDRRGRVHGVTVKDREGFRDLPSKAVVLACGSYEASPEMRLRYLGTNWELLPIRGTRYNTGDGLRMALEVGAQPGGHWGCAHAVQLDINAPDIPDKSVADHTARHGYNMGIIVNIEGKRFVDEGEDWRPYTYNKFGRVIINTQPQQRAFQIFDAEMAGLLSPRYLRGTSVTAGSIEELGQKLGINPDALAQTVAEYNAGVKAGAGVWDINTLDGKHTVGVSPPKSNWAKEIEHPPFVAYPTRAGITFAFAGLKVNGRLQVLDTEGEVIPGLYAAGEMAGFWSYNYMGGTGLMWGSVSGRTAGAEAAGL